MSDEIEYEQTLIIRSSEWARGYGSALLVVDAGGAVIHQYCCLGLHAKQCGIDDNKLRNRADPGSIRDLEIPAEYASLWIRDEPGDFGEWNNSLAQLAMNINDMGWLTDVERIRQLQIHVFDKMKIKLDWRPNE